jgi:hypothetical protein
MSDDTEFKLDYVLGKNKALKGEITLFKALFLKLCRAETPAERQTTIDNICLVLDITIDED